MEQYLPAEVIQQFALLLNKRDLSQLCSISKAEGQILCRDRIFMIEWVRNYYPDLVKLYLKYIEGKDKLGVNYLQLFINLQNQIDLGEIVIEDSYTKVGIDRLFTLAGRQAITIINDRHQIPDFNLYFKFSSLFDYTDNIISFLLGILDGKDIDLETRLKIVDDFLINYEGVGKNEISSRINVMKYALDQSLSIDLYFEDNAELLTVDMIRVKGYISYEEGLKEVFSNEFDFHVVIYFGLLCYNFEFAERMSRFNPVLLEQLHKEGFIERLIATLSETAQYQSYIEMIFNYILSLTTIPMKIIVNIVAKYGNRDLLEFSLNQCALIDDVPIENGNVISEIIDCNNNISSVLVLADRLTNNRKDIIYKSVRRFIIRYVHSLINSGPGENSSYEILYYFRDHCEIILEILYDSAIDYGYFDDDELMEEMFNVVNPDQIFQLALDSDIYNFSEERWQVESRLAVIDN